MKNCHDIIPQSQAIARWRLTMLYTARRRCCLIAIHVNMMNSDDAAAAAAAVGAASGAELVGEEQEPSEEEVQPETRLKRQKLVEWRASYEKDSIKEYLIAGMVNNKNEPDEAGRNSMGKFQHALAELGLNKDSPPQEIWYSRPEYQEFELKVFTQRIYQEIKRTKYINYLNDKREKKAAAEEQHRRDRDYTFP